MLTENARLWAAVGKNFLEIIAELIKIRDIYIESWKMFLAIESDTKPFSMVTIALVPRTLKT